MTESPEAEEAPASEPAKPQRQRAAAPDGPIDIRAALEGPVRVKQDGKSKPVDPYEAMLRQHVKKAIVKQNLTSIKLVLEEAEKHGLIAKPSPPPRGGVLVVPKGLPAEIEESLFDDEDYADHRRSTIVTIMWAVYETLGFDRLVRCFHGDRE